MFNLVSLVKKGIEDLSDDLNSGLKQFSQNPLKYTGQVALDYVDAAGAVAAGYAFCDTGSEVLGKYRVPIMFAGVATAIVVPIVAQAVEEGILDLSYNPTSRGAYRFARNLSLGLTSLLFFWYNGKENVAPIPQIISKATSSLTLITAFIEDKQRKCAPIKKCSVK